MGNNINQSKYKTSPLKWITILMNYNIKHREVRTENVYTQ